MAVILNPDPESAVAARILAVAVSILAEVGEAGLRVDDVMSGASVQAPVIYRHFGSREGLVQSAHLARFLDSMRIGSDRFLDETLAATDAASFRVAFDAMVDAVLSSDNIAVGIVRLEVLGMSTRRPEVADVVRTMLATNYAKPLKALEVAQQRGWIRADVDLMRFLIWVNSSTLGVAAVSNFGAGSDIADRCAGHYRRAAHAVIFGSDC